MGALKLTAVLLTALALVPSGAHFFELANKIGLPQQQYFVVQQIYRGWALFGVVLFLAIIANWALAVGLWRRGERACHAFAAGLLIALTLAIFFAWIYPANKATSNWTTVPTDWQQLRTHWEYGHAVNAVLSFAALTLATIAAIGRQH